MGLVKCCLYTFRRMQQPAVSCERSNCNGIRTNSEIRTSEVLSKTANNVFLRSIMTLCISLMCGLSFELLRAPAGIAPLLATSWRKNSMIGVSFVPFPNSLCRWCIVFNSSLKSERFFNLPDVLSLLRGIRRFLLYREYSSCDMW